MRLGKLTSTDGNRTRSPWWTGLREDFIRWVTRRHRADGRQARITRDRAYILPTRQGYMLLAILLVMLLGSINYSNNMAFLLTFLLVGIGHNAMWYTHRNLLGLSITTLPVQPVFAGTRPQLRLRLEDTDRRAREALLVTIGDRGSQPAFVEPGQSADVTVALERLPRGIHHPRRQRLATRYPLGLLEAWTWLTLDTEILVYPAPIAACDIPLAAEESPEGQAANFRNLEGSPDEIREYRPGDAPNRIAWKAVARSGRLFVRDSTSGAGTPAWLDWDHVQGTDPEFRLGVLCHLVLKAHASGQPFGLRLPGHRLGPNRGLEHRDRCLRALATFGLPERGTS